MFQIGKLYHIVHVVDDLDAADRWYDDVFAVRRFYKGYHKVAMRDASLIAIADLVMEPMMSSKVAGVEKTAIYKFHVRFGQHLHSIAWYTQDMEGAFQALRTGGLRALNEAGLPLEAPPTRGGMFTHPRETFGQLEFARPGGLEDPRLQPGWSVAPWRDEHPLGILRTSHITVAVRDVAHARALYESALGARLLHQTAASDRRNAFMAVGRETVVELAQPMTRATFLGRDLEKNGEIVHAVTFQVRDLGKAETFLKGRGMRVIERAAESFTVHPADAFGAVFAFTSRAVPNDPRS